MIVTKKIFLIVSLFLIVSGVGMFFYHDVHSEPTKEYHVCTFNKDSLNINCSPELRIKIGYKKIQTSQTAENNSSVTCEVGGKCYYKVDIYSENNSVNLLKILPKDLSMKNNSEVFSNIFTFRYRIIRVRDINSGRVFDFYIDKSGKYNVNSGDALIKYNKELCMSNNGGNVCMPEQNGRCSQGLDYTDGCNKIVYLISQGKASDSLCYKLKYPSLVSYCLGKVDIDKCYDYAKSEPQIKNMCDTIKCQNENMIEDSSGKKYLMTDKCNNVFYSK